MKKILALLGTLLLTLCAIPQAWAEQLSKEERARRFREHVGGNIYEIGGSFESKKTAFASAKKKAKDKNTSVSNIWVLGNINGVKGRYRFAPTGELVLALSPVGYGKYLKEAEDIHRVCVKKLSIAGSVLVLHGAIRGVSGTERLHFFDNVSKHVDMLAMGAVQFLVIANRSGSAGLFKLVSPTDESSAVLIEHGSNGPIYPIGDLLKARLETPDGPIYCASKIPNIRTSPPFPMMSPHKDSLAFVFILLKKGGLSDQKKISKDEFGSEKIAIHIGRGRKVDTTSAMPPTPPATSTDKQLRMWILLAKNFINQKDFPKAESYLKRVIKEQPDGTLAKEAKALMNKIEAAKTQTQQ
jgi:hypothetical protein